MMLLGHIQRGSFLDPCQCRHRVHAACKMCVHNGEAGVTARCQPCVWCLLKARKQVEEFLCDGVEFAAVGAHAFMCIHSYKHRAHRSRVHAERPHLSTGLPVVPASMISDIVAAAQQRGLQAGATGGPTPGTQPDHGLWTMYETDRRQVVHTPAPGPSEIYHAGNATLRDTRCCPREMPFMTSADGLAVLDPGPPVVASNDAGASSSNTDPSATQESAGVQQLCDVKGSGVGLPITWMLICDHRNVYVCPTQCHTAVTCVRGMCRSDAWRGHKRNLHTTNVPCASTQAFLCCTQHTHSSRKAGTCT